MHDEKQGTLRPDQRIVVKMPLTELWDDGGTLTGDRVRNLDQTDLVELLRTGPVQFLVADPGLKLRWVPTPRQFDQDCPSRKTHILGAISERDRVHCF